MIDMEALVKRIDRVVSGQAKALIITVRNEQTKLRVERSTIEIYQNDVLSHAIVWGDCGKISDNLYAFWFADGWLSFDSGLTILLDMNDITDVSLVFEGYR